MMFEIPITEFKNLKIGNMENTDAGTGCTVFLFEKGAPAGLDVRGGGPASEESELLKPMAAAEKIHAIVLSGGSAFGLEVSNGVREYLEERDIGFDVGVTKVPLVCQSCLFDLSVGDERIRLIRRWDIALVKMLRFSTIRMEIMAQVQALQSGS